MYQLHPIFYQKLFLMLKIRTILLIENMYIDTKKNIIIKQYIPHSVQNLKLTFVLIFNLIEKKPNTRFILCTVLRR